MFSRRNKFISFTNDGDVQLDLDFNVPFLTIPIKRLTNETLNSSSLATINVGSLIITGIILIGAVFILPMILLLFDKKVMIPSWNPLTHGLSYYHRTNKRISRDITSNPWKRAQSCAQQAVCYALKKSAENVAKGNGSSMEKILDGLASNEWIQDVAVSTAIKEAIKNALENSTCPLIYEQECNLNFINYAKI